MTVEIPHLPKEGRCGAPGVHVQHTLHVQYNSSAIAVGNGTATCEGNMVGGNLQVQGNTGAVAIFNNTITQNLQCSGNTAVTGGGNVAKQKQGQCSAY